MTTIEGTAFYACTGLTNVLFGNGVNSLGEAVFENCIALTSVTIPDSVTNVGDDAFYACTSLAGAFFTARHPTHSLLTETPLRFIICLEPRTGAHHTEE